MSFLKLSMRGGVRQGFWSILLILIVIAGCREGEMNDVAWTGTRDTVQGVEIVRGPYRVPFAKSPTHVRELWRATDTGGRGPWEEPRMLALANGRVAVLDPQAHRAYVLSTGSGEELGDFGGEGGGPGELQRPFGIDFVGEAFIERMLERARVKAVYAAFRTDATTGRVYVLDQTPADSGGDAATLHVLDQMGRYLARLSFDRPWRTFAVSGDRIYALEQEPATGLTTLVAYEVDVASGYTID